MNRQSKWSRSVQEACFKEYLGDALEEWEVNLLDTVPKQTKSNLKRVIENYGLIPMDRKKEPKEGSVLTNELMCELRKIAYTYPDLYLDEMADALEDAEGVRVSSMTIYKALQTRMSLNMKTAGKMAKAHDDEQRQRFLDQLSRIILITILILYIKNYVHSLASYNLLLQF